MSHVWRHGPTDRNDLIVLLAIADFADDDGFCWPSTQRIAEKARMTRRGAQKVIRRLAENGHLKIEVGGGRGGSNRYHVTLIKGEPETANTVQGGANPETQRANPETQRANSGSPKPSRTIKEPSDKIRATLCSVLSESVADDFIDHRKSKRAKLTLRAAELIAAELRDLPEPESAVLRSIKNGWTGVFPEKRNGKPDSTTDGSAADAAQRAGKRWEARGMDRGAGSGPSQPLLPAGQPAGSEGRGP